MLILTKSRFIATPHVNPEWIKTIILEGRSAKNLVTALIPFPYYVPWSLSPPPGDGLFTFGFVRNPFDWYRAYWVKMIHHVGRSADLNDAYRAGTFPGFIDLVLEKTPGLASDVFQASTLDWSIDFIGKYENIYEDLTTALKRSGEIYENPWPKPPTHETKNSWSSYDLTYRPDQIDSIRVADELTFKRAGYSQDL